MAVLLVDDEPRMRETLARVLMARGWRVDQAATRDEAVAAALAGDHRLLLLDVNLPDGAGWDVLRALRAAGKAIPAAIVSGGPPSAARLREFEPVAVLRKPFPLESLLRIVQAAEAS
jgi:two-component system copper resistance phosphate regulon response regulator CusR